MSSYYKDNTRRELESRKKNGSNNVGGSFNAPQNAPIGNTLKQMDTMVLENTKHMSNTIKKIYERHFISRSDLQNEMNRGEKLNVYYIMGVNRRNEDEMIYLMEKIKNDRLKSPLEAVLSTMLLPYPNLISSEKINSLNYFVIDELFKL